VVRLVLRISNALMCATNVCHSRIYPALLAATVLGGCGSGEVEPPANSYLTDPAYRRAELVRSLVNPDNGYSRLRLQHYESGDALSWSNLPEWNPPTAPFDAAATNASGSGAPSGSEGHSLAIDEAARAGSEDALVALGKAAFFAYPMQFAPAAEKLIRSRADADRYGLWSDAAHGTGGLVVADLADGTKALAQTCATCHAAMRDGALVPGAPNERLDWGALMVDGSPTDGGNAGELLQWGPGRIDVTTTDGTEPCRIADLRPVRWLTHLHQDATVEQWSVASLAIRIETLVITAHGQVLRPPIEVALGLALYVRTLGNDLAPGQSSTDQERRGAASFDRTCSGCHASAGFTGPPVPIDVVGSDPVLGNSADRGTGTYRVPSLLGVASRGPLLHDGRAPDLDALFDPARLQAGYARALHGSGPIVGHPFGLDFDDSERADLLAFLNALR
jgi:mono/diheme cytochrome c family protein